MHDDNIDDGRADNHLRLQYDDLDHARARLHDGLRLGLVAEHRRRLRLEARGWRVRSNLPLSNAGCSRRSMRH